MPELPCKNTVREDMLHSFLFLVTEDTGLWVAKLSSFQHVSSPVLIINSKPYESLAFRVRPALPDSLSRLKSYSTSEENFVSRLSCEQPRIGEPPNMLVSPIMELEVFQHLSQL